MGPRKTQFSAREAKRLQHYRNKLRTDAITASLLREVLDASAEKAHQELSALAQRKADRLLLAKTFMRDMTYSVLNDHYGPVVLVAPQNQSRHRARLEHYRQKWNDPHLVSLVLDMTLGPDGTDSASAPPPPPRPPRASPRTLQQKRERRRHLARLRYQRKKKLGLA